jgi:3-methyladenine DNA glycosylase AlkD
VLDVGLDDAGVIEASRLDVDVRGVRRRRREHRRSTLRAERARDEVAAVRPLRERLQVTLIHAKHCDFELDADVERAAGYAPAVRAVAIPRRADRAFVAVPHRAAQTTAHDRENAGHGLAQSFLSIVRVSAKLPRVPKARTEKASLAAARADLRALADPARAKGVAAFFKTRPGEYGEGDVFLGVRVPELRKVARARAALTLRDLAALLRSRFHEERLLALMVLVTQYEKGDGAERQARFAFYLEHLACVNNWDLVDASAAPIVGAHVLASRDRRLLPRLAGSKVLWERRVAMVATYAFIRAGESATTFEIAKLLLRDEHDLMHKAVGWMLREVGKRVSAPALRGFLEAHAANMPRTALRYAIERFPEAERRRWLGVKRRT